MKGHDQDAIALALGISQAAVSKILKRVFDRKTETMEEQVAQAKHIVAARLEWVSAEASAAWERSKLDAETERTTINTKKLGKSGDVEARQAEDIDRDPEDIGMPLYVGEDGEEIEPEERARRLREAGRRDAEQVTDGGAPVLTIVEEKTSATTTTAGQTGNPAHLANVLKATEDIRQLYGIDAPKDSGSGTVVVVKVYEGSNIESEV